MNSLPLKVALTIDVEEEGLFKGSYGSGTAGVSNVAHLWRLDPLFRDFGIKPTLLTSYQVSQNAQCRQLLLKLKRRWSSEIGAHLHHWNTDPKVELGHKPPVPSELIPRELLRDKTEKLLESLTRISGERPTSFRMGRFNLGPKMFLVLGETGFSVDSSIEPLRSEYGGPDHLVAFSDPYYPDPNDPRKRGFSGILEVPITINPILPHVDVLLEKARSAGLLWNDALLSIASRLVSVPAQPAWLSLRAAKFAVTLHRLKGGHFLTIFFHSSELAPGLNPLNPDEESVQNFLKKLRRFFSWLTARYDVRFITLSEAPEFLTKK